VSLFQDPDTIDRTSISSDGRVILTILSPTRLDGSPTTISAVTEKLDRYLAFIESSDFEARFGRDPLVRIWVECNGPPGRAVLDAVSARMVEWSRQARWVVDIMWQYKEDAPNSGPAV
jgi:hypothetical protein